MNISTGKNVIQKCTKKKNNFSFHTITYYISFLLKHTIIEYQQGGDSHWGKKKFKTI